MGSEELEEKLLEAGKVLDEPPSSATELLSQLDLLGKLLGKVDQSPSKSMLQALSPTINSLVQQKYLRNENEDMRVAVAYCISEITRITAPEAPYDDDHMKEVFQLIVSSFEMLSDDSSSSYSKRTSILETLAKVRSCVVMLDLECDDLIVEMFQHFLKTIRDHHPETVFSNMEIIMTLVLDESEDSVLNLISPILASLEKDNQEVQPIARKLAGNVIEKCAEKLKPCLLEAKSSKKFSFYDYSSIISRICVKSNHIGNDNYKSSGEQLNEMKMDDGATAVETTQGDENKLDAPSSDEAPQEQVTKEIIAETPEGQDRHAPIISGPGEDQSALLGNGSGENNNNIPIETSPEEENPVPMETYPEDEHPVPVESGPVEALPAPAISLKSTTSNGISETENKDISKKPEHTNDEEDRSHDDANVEGKAELAGSDREKEAKVKTKSAQIISKKRSRKTKHSTKLAVLSKLSSDTDAKAKLLTDSDVNLDKEVHASPSEDHKIETEKVSSTKTLESEPEKVLSPSPSGSALDEGLSKKDRLSNKKNKSSKKASPSEDIATKKATKKASTRDSPAEKAQFPFEISNFEGGSESDSDRILVKKSGKKADIKDQAGNGSISKKKVDEKKRVHEKEAVYPPKSSKLVKGDSPLEETLKTSSKRKRTPTAKNVTNVKRHGEDLIGSRIKVWWPMDKIFYEGVVDSFDGKTRKHKVIYADGDLEHLNLREERWELAEDGGSMEGEQEIRTGAAETSPEMPKKKKAKPASEPSSTKGKTQGSSDIDASSSKSKSTAMKSSGKSVDKNSKDDGNLTEVTPKSKAKSEDIVGKSKVCLKKPGGKSIVDASLKAVESEDEDSVTPKPIVKFKLSSPKTSSKDISKTATKDKSITGSKDSPKASLKDLIKGSSKSNMPKSGSKSITNGTGKAKSGSAKSKETREKESSPELVQSLKTGKGKPADASKGKNSGEISGKKRKKS